MRNPSPYNLFTDISPGLFTHVGVVASETGDDGVARIVLVDLPERGSRMPATKVDTCEQARGITSCCGTEPRKLRNKSERRWPP